MTDKKSEAQRAREQYAALAQHYQAIGPADLLAAVMALQSRKDDEKPSPRARAA